MRVVVEWMLLCVSVFGQVHAICLATVFWSDSVVSCTVKFRKITKTIIKVKVSTVSIYDSAMERGKAPSTTIRIVWIVTIDCRTLVLATFIFSLATVNIESLGSEWTTTWCRRLSFILLVLFELEKFLDICIYLLNFSLLSSRLSFQIIDWCILLSILGINLINFGLLCIDLSFMVCDLGLMIINFGLMFRNLGLLILDFCLLFVCFGLQIVNLSLMLIWFGQQVGKLGLLLSRFSF